MPTKVLSVIGTRPEAIKLAPVIRALTGAAGRGVVSTVCTTGQHREMLHQALQVFGITPDLALDLMVANQSPARAAAGILAAMDDVIRSEQPDWVLVQGDTTTVAAAALAAFYNGIRVGHVEAGLRTYDKRAPFPEEGNRRVTGVVADLHFAPTERARQHLLQEQTPPGTIVVTGNTGIDALHWVAGQPSSPDARMWLDRAGLGAGRRLVLVTAHRRENFGAPLGRVCDAIRRLAQRYRDDITVLYPVHLNPRVLEPVRANLADVPNVLLAPPLDYATLVHVMAHAYLVMTDSGGIQEEAPGLGVPVLVFRDVTERPEAVEAGSVRLVGTDTATILSEAARVLDHPDIHADMAHAVNPYGDGQAAGRIVSALLNEPSSPFVALPRPRCADARRLRPAC